MQYASAKELNQFHRGYSVRSFLDAFCAVQDVDIFAFRRHRLRDARG